MVLADRWPPLPAYRAGARRRRPVPGGRGASRWLVPEGQRGLSPAALARVRDGRIKVAVAWRRARRLDRLRRRRRRPDAWLPGPGAVPRAPLVRAPRSS